MRIQALIVSLFVLGGCQSPERPPNAGTGPTGGDTPASWAELVCAFESSCGVHPGQVRYCLQSKFDDDVALPLGLYEDQSQLSDCLEGATSCADYAACLGEPGCESGCDGSVLRECHSLRDGLEVTTEFDCASRGMTCDETGYGCRTDVPCDDITDHEQMCIDGKAYTCDADYQPFAYVFDCPALGLGCSGGACVDEPAQPCVDDAAASCAGDAIVGCFDGARLTGDCRRLRPDWSCLDESNGGNEYPRCGAPPGVATCSDEDPGRCEGTVAVNCVLGSEFRVDCGLAGATCADEGRTCVFAADGEPDMGVADMNVTDAAEIPDVTGLQTDFSGQYFLATELVASRVTMMAVETAVDTNDWTIDLRFQFLSSDMQGRDPRENPRELVGEVVTVPDVPLADDGAFEVSFETLQVPAEAHSANVATTITLTLHALVTSQTSWCGRATGEVIHPVAVPWDTTFGTAYTPDRDFANAPIVLSCGPSQ